MPCLNEALRLLKPDKNLEKSVWTGKNSRFIFIDNLCILVSLVNLKTGIIYDILKYFYIGI